MIPEPGDLLYHYTSATGLLGIIDSKTIWATRADHLNDSREVWHGIKMIKELLPDFESGHPAVPVARDLFETRPEEDIPKLFIAAWTEEGDQLSQWRGYGSGGAAYSLGFSRQALYEKARAEEWRLERCLYKEDEQREELRLAISTMISQAVELRYAEPWRSQYDPANPESAESFSWQLYSFLLQSAARMKHSGFREEKEWRLVTNALTTPVTVRHRAQAHAIVPYTAVPLPERDGRLDIRQTIIGPTAEQSRAYAAVHSLYVTSSLLESDGSLRGEIRHSEIPYRYW